MTPAPELAFVAACCRFPTDPGAVVRAHAEVRDWPAVARLARVHRVAGFVLRALAFLDADGVPPPISSEIAEEARQASLMSMRHAAEEVRVAAAFAERGIDAVFVKGASLAMRVHGSLALRSSRDADVLVAPADFAAAAQLLEALGFVAEATTVTPTKEWSFAHPERGTVVELHRVLVDWPGLRLDVGLASPRQRVALSSQATVQTLADRELLVYLAVHGTLHRWERLKWLADIAALAPQSGATLDELLADAARLGTVRPVAGALLLAHRLLALDLPASDVRRLERDAAARRLCMIGEREIAASAPASIGMARSLRLYHTQLALAHGIRGKLAAVAMLLARPRWRFQEGLPAPLRLATTLAAALLRVAGRLPRARPDGR